MFAIKEIFKSFQGEGSKVGHPCIFVRFAGCNLWSGQEHLRDKGRGDCALWCDTDFFRGDKYTPEQLLMKMNNLTADSKVKMVVFTGGEPTLQLRKTEAVGLIQKLLNIGWIVAVETNGTLGFQECPVLETIYNHPNGHITVSPKLLKGSMEIDHIKLRSGTDLKIICPTNLPIEEFATFNFEYFYLQPMDQQDGNPGMSELQDTLHLCRKYGWRLSCQTHKLVQMR